MTRKKNHRRKKRRGSTLWHIATTISVGRAITVVVCLLFSGAVEGLGIASLVPLLALAGGDTNTQTSELGRLLVDTLALVGLQPDPGVLIGILVGGMIGKALLVIVAMRQVATAVAEVGTHMRLSLMDALLEARWSFFTRQPLGRFANALGTETYRSGDAFNAVAQFASHSIQALVYLAIAALVSWELAILAMVTGLIMVLSLNRLVAVTKRSARRQVQRMKSMINRLADLLIGLKPMKAMARHARFNVLFTKDVEGIHRAMRTHILSRHANRALQEPILAICLGVGIYFALTVAHLGLGELVVMTLLLVKTVSSIGKAQQDLQAVRGTEASYWAVQDAIDEAREAREPEHGGLPPTFERGIEVRDVSLSFGKNRVIANASCTIERGKVTSIAGRSGAGKTTLVDLLLGLHQPDSGEILIDGVDLRELNTMRWRSMIGYVPQELILFHDSIAMNVTLGDPAYSREDVENALRQADAWEFISALPDGVDHVVGERGALLSGGQRQRIALARALVHRPSLLILDEATSALDPQTEKMIVGNVVDLARRTGLTVLSITHQPAWVRLSDSVVQMEEGVVTQSWGPVVGHATEARAIAE